MNRHVLAVDLKDDPQAIASYREHHRHVWPEVLASLRRAGVERMDIHVSGRRLVMIVELADGVDLRRAFAAHAVSSPRVAEWERLMKSLQQPVPGAPDGEWWAAMEQVFTLDQEAAQAGRHVAAGAHRAERSRTS
jgi:L-rhamnose mutarotase